MRPEDKPQHLDLQQFPLKSRLTLVLGPWLRQRDQAEAGTWHRPSSLSESSSDRTGPACWSARGSAPRKLSWPGTSLRVRKCVLRITPTPPGATWQYHQRECRSWIWPRTPAGIIPWIGRAELPVGRPSSLPRICFGAAPPYQLWSCCPVAPNSPCAPLFSLTPVRDLHSSVARHNATRWGTGLQTRVSHAYLRFTSSCPSQ